MVLEKFLGLANLSGIQTLYIYKAIKVVVICEDKHFVLATFQIITPYLKDFKDS